MLAVTEVTTFFNSIREKKIKYRDKRVERGKGENSIIVS